mmetsp:Transcript_43690/g.95116  ORF Transcript_43690/g.95116 Transcript_43690/m.95116 type:complete len:165 (-) Transcript_43690:81-575(-)
MASFSSQIVLFGVLALSSATLPGPVPKELTFGQDSQSGGESDLVLSNLDVGTIDLTAGWSNLEEHVELKVPRTAISSDDKEMQEQEEQEEDEEDEDDESEEPCASGDCEPIRLKIVLSCGTEACGNAANTTFEKVSLLGRSRRFRGAMPRRLPSSASKLTNPGI